MRRSKQGRAMLSRNIMKKTDKDYKRPIHIYYLLDEVKLKLVSIWWHFSNLFKAKVLLVDFGDVSLPMRLI